MTPHCHWDDKSAAGVLGRSPGSQTFGWDAGRARSPPPTARGGPPGARGGGGGGQEDTRRGLSFLRGLGPRPPPTAPPPPPPRPPKGEPPLPPPPAREPCLTGLPSRGGEPAALR